MSPYAVLPEIVVKALPQLSACAVKVAVAVASFMGKNRTCFPAIHDGENKRRETIAKRAGYSQRRSVEVGLAELRGKGILKSAQQFQHKPNIYTWATPDPNENAVSETVTENSDPNDFASRPERKRTLLYS